MSQSDSNPMKRFTIIIHGPPVDSQASETALRFARSVLEQGHEITRLFFYRSGVLNASKMVLAPQDERALPDEWATLVEQHKLDAVVCIANAIRRGITNAAESERFGKSGSSLIETIELSGLGQLVSASLESDRVITFGGRS